MSMQALFKVNDIQKRDGERTNECKFLLLSSSSVNKGETVRGTLTGINQSVASGVIASSIILFVRGWGMDGWSSDVLNLGIIRIVVVLEFGGPESEVVSNKLHDGGGILVLVFLNVFDVGDGVIESLLGEGACFGGVVHHFVVKHREVEGES